MWTSWTSFRLQGAKRLTSKKQTKHSTNLDSICMTSKKHNHILFFHEGPIFKNETNLEIDTQNLQIISPRISKKLELINRDEQFRALITLNAFQVQNFNNIRAEIGFLKWFERLNVLFFRWIPKKSMQLFTFSNECILQV